MIAVKFREKNDIERHPTSPVYVTATHAEVGIANVFGGTETIIQIKCKSENTLVRINGKVIKF